MSNWFKALILSIIITSCGSPRGKVYQIDNLEIYYNVPKGSVDWAANYIKPLGEFFKENNLIHSTKKHSIKLISTPEKFILKMILNDSLKNVPLDMLKEIEYLEAAIGESVFKNANFAIQITDAYFKPLIETSN